MFSVQQTIAEYSIKFALYWWKLASHWNFYGCRASSRTFSKTEELYIITYFPKRNKMSNYATSISTNFVWNILLHMMHNYKPSPIERCQNCLYTPTASWRNRTQKLCRSKAWWTNRQTNRETKKLRFLAAEPRQTWHGDRGPRERSCTLKTFGDPTHSFDARGHWTLVGNLSPSTWNPHNSVMPWANPSKF